MVPEPAELGAASDFIRDYFSAQSGAPVPFSFIYDGRPSSDHLPRWTRSARSEAVEGTGASYVLKVNDPRTGLEVRVEALACQDAPAVEWVVRLRNSGASDTPLLEQIQALDLLLPCPDSCVLHYAKGSLCSLDDFAPVERRLRRGASLRLTPGGGRSSSEVLPFFSIERHNPERDTEGVLLAVGWTGEWAVEFARASDGALRARAGMDLTRLLLHPGEEIRTPRVLLLFWRGDRIRGHNMLRAYLLRSRPLAGGSALVVPTFAATWGATPASIHLGNIARLEEQRLPIDCYWIDAGWFGQGPWHLAPGTWKENAALYPRGMRQVSEAAHRSGRKFLLWFEPHRVTPGSAWAREHPEWLLRVPPEDEVTSWPSWADMDDPAWRFAESRRNRIAPGDALLDLGVPEARRFLADFISRCIEDLGLDWYREDFNIAPLAFWRRADPPERQGITEIRWIEGLYAFWDELLARHPGLLIDNCASGGRRIDLETLRRTIPLWRTDAPGSPEGRQCHTWGLSLWVPLSCTGGLGDLTVASDYEFRSSLAAGIVCGFWNGGDNVQSEPYRGDLPYERARSLLQVFERVRSYFYGEYYPLSEYSVAMDAWLAFQFHRPDLDEGMVLVFKRPRSALREAAYSLRGLEPDARYEVRSEDTGGTGTFSGLELADSGLVVRLDARPASALFVYRRAYRP